MPYKDKDLQKKYQREWTSARRAAFFAGRACGKCGSTDRLELDHITRIGKIEHRIWSWSDEKRNAETAKCQVLCYSCHKKKTASETHAKLEHGVTMYETYGCRCVVCRSAKSEKNRRYRDSQKTRRHND